ncbi:hypothetical protein ABPG77_005219 [Micractinium sp. CCAP 211/92]
MALDLAVLGAALAVLLLFIATLLFGQNPLLARTPLPRLHRLLTRTAPAAAASAARRLGGRRAASLLEAASRLCCERSNPAVQILFLVLLVGCYTLFYRTIFPMLPLPRLPAWHKYTGTAAALLCLALFLAAGLADPGTITPSNAAAHAALYPPDGLWYPEKHCSTCQLPRPARSKHCRVCNRCIARVDHHCIWINACVGLANMRYFLGFLLATAGVCLYGAVPCGTARHPAGCAAYAVLPLVLPCAGLCAGPRSACLPPLPRGPLAGLTAMLRQGSWPCRARPAPRAPCWRRHFAHLLMQAWCWGRRQSGSTWPSRGPGTWPFSFPTRVGGMEGQAEGPSHSRRDCGGFSCSPQRLHAHCSTGPRCARPGAGWCHSPPRQQRARCPPPARRPAGVPV